MTDHFFIHTAPSNFTALDVPAFPWLRMDAERFVWEEALYEGNYLTVHHSASGRCQSKENIYTKLQAKRFPVHRMYAFELEVDGQLLRDGWVWRDATVTATPEGWKHLTVELQDPTVNITVQVHTLQDGTAFLTRWLEIRNTSSRPVSLSRVFPWAGLVVEEGGGWSAARASDASDGFRLGRFLHHTWCTEGDFAWMPLPTGTFTEQLLGTKYHPPMFVLHNELTGEWTVMHVECTMPVEASFTREWSRAFGGDYVYARVGLGGKAPFRVLQPGETAQSPLIHLSMCNGDLDSCVNALYAHIRRSVMPANTPQSTLVEYNHTGYTLNAQISRELLCREVDMAAEIGVELFLVDAGWFGPREKGWMESIGDWEENPILGQGGLAEVFGYARTKGMKCGLWMPPEIISKGVPIYQQHPEWFTPELAFGFMQFDLLQPEVEEYVYSTICSAVERFQLDCYRIDMAGSEMGDRVTAHGTRENRSWRYFEKLYRIFERVRARFPHLLLENCSGGGGRSDLAMLRRFHYTQITDDWSPGDQIRILNGMTLALTPEQCMPLVGSINMSPADIDFVVRTGLFGHFTASGVFPTHERINHPTLARWKHGIALYKEVIRPLLPTCRVYHHTPVQNYRHPGAWVVLEYASSLGDTAVIGIFRLQASQENTYTVIPRGIDPARQYRVTFDNTGHTVILPGHQLSAQGLSVRVPDVLMSELVLVSAVNE